MHDSYKPIKSICVRYPDDDVINYTVGKNCDKISVNDNGNYECYSYFVRGRYLVCSIYDVSLVTYVEEF